MSSSNDFFEKIIRRDKDGKIIFSNDIIIKANQLIYGKHKVSAVEQKVFNLSLSKVRYDTNLCRPVAVLTLDEVREMLNCNNNSIYRHIDNLSQSLHDKKIIIYNPDNHEYLMMGLINIVEYRRGKLTLKFEPESTDLILNLKTNYTKLDLSIYKKLNNIYAIRLYEIFKSKLFKDVKKIDATYGINNLKLTIGMIQSNPDINKAIIKGGDVESAIEKYNTDTSFENIGSFKRAINSAVKEINDITDIYVEYKVRKSGKGGAIKSITFTAMNKDLLKNIKVYNNEISKPSDDEILNIIFEIKNLINELTPVEIRQLLESANYDKDKVIEKYNLSKKVKNIDNLMAWMLSAIKNDYKIVQTKSEKKETNKFNNFEQRNYSDEQLEELEKKLLAK